ncbi:MAG: phosphoribosylamine--glycine ligase [Solirubrobacteraceae bacterium]
MLLIGKDARTDAIAAACVASPQRPELFALSELAIPGLCEKCVQVFYGALTDTNILREVVSQVRPDLAIIGPEEPLAAGYADVLGSLGVPTFGPSQRLAAIEASKSWARQLLADHGIPGNPEYRVFESESGLRAYLAELGGYVVKPDGLTAGKGVRVEGDHLKSLDEGFAYATSVLASDGRVQIEEKLVGEEFSLQTITDGKAFIHCPLVQDHKRAFEGDTGPNTGGMGSYSCADFSLPFLEPSDVAEAQAINEQVIEALERETGEPYCGVLYGGFIATRDGVRLIEYNCRFGDPEAMNVLPLLQADFVELCAAAAAGQLADVAHSFAPKATVCKYVVPERYPQASTPGGVIQVPAELRDGTGARWYWAACRAEGAEVLLSSSRAGAVVGIGDTLSQAEKAAEDAMAQIAGPIRHRTDIGKPDVISRKIRHMQTLREVRVSA